MDVGLEYYNHQKINAFIRLNGVTTQQLPPAMVHLQNSAWNFFPLKSNAWTSPGNWNGYPAPCTRCVAKRMTTIDLGNGNNIDDDESCFGACNGLDNQLGAQHRRSAPGTTKQRRCLQRRFSRSTSGSVRTRFWMWASLALPH